MSKEVKKEKDVELLLRRRHPKKQIRLGRHLITVEAKKFSLNEEELKELESKGCKHWIATPDQLKEEREAKKADQEAIKRKIANLEKQLPSKSAKK